MLERLIGHCCMRQVATKQTVQKAQRDPSTGIPLSVFRRCDSVSKANSHRFIDPACDAVTFTIQMAKLE